jgi:hypothetical protein
MQEYHRVLEWDGFSEMVRRHIIEYTIIQYGDAPDDEVERWTEEMCVNAISKYVKRFGAMVRGKSEQQRDLMKIAHFACLAFTKGERT